MRNNKNRATASGMTLIELVVALVITGIAIAGITEITFINGFWTLQSLNKVDNIYAAKQFLERISRELRQAKVVGTTSSSQLITFSMPTDGAIDANGFPTATTTVTYQVIPDPNTPLSPAPKEYLIQVSYNGGLTWNTILHSLVGPQPIGGGVPKVFQYVAKDFDPADAAYGVTDIPNNPSSVIINLELRRQDYGSSASTNVYLSTAGVRSEIFLRSNTGRM